MLKGKRKRKRAGPERDDEKISSAPLANVKKTGPTILRKEKN